MESVDMFDYAMPCLSYALRRLGLCKGGAPEALRRYSAPYHDKVDYLRLEFFKKLPYTSTLEDVGDILVWEREPSGTWATVQMTLGVPLTTHVKCGFHCGVYEGGGLYSHLVFPDGYIPRICVEELKETVKPAYVYRLNTILE